MEKMIADNLPDLGLPIEEQIMQTMANLATAYAEEIEACSTPFIDDPALSGNDLAAKYQYSDFLHFAKKLDEHLSLLADKGTENSIWKEILGKNFPSGKSSEKHVSIIASASREAALSVQHRQPLAYPKQAPKPNATITATAILPSGETYMLPNDGASIPKGSTIVYRANCGPVKNGHVKWQVTNTGNEAMRICPRGGFEDPNEGRTSRREITAYTGKHYVQCFVIRKRSCVRWSAPFFINVE